MKTLLLWALAASAATDNFGPYNATFLQGGVGLAKQIPAVEAWSLGGWLRIQRSTPGQVVVAVIGDPPPAPGHALMLDDGELALRLDATTTLRAAAPVGTASWRFVAATWDGSSARLYVDGTEVAEHAAASGSVAPMLRLAPESQADLTGAHHFGGQLALFQLYPRAMSAGDIAQLNTARPDFDLIRFHEVGVGWPWQEYNWRGLLEPQPAWTLPHGNAPAATPVRDLTPTATPPLQALGADRWAIGSWHLIPAPAIKDSGADLSRAQYKEQSWYPAVVPGTVLTTLIANGVYPDPDYGLNNLAIPESLSHQDYWYRAQFPAPARLAGRQLTVTCNGINFASDIWLNGVNLGSTRGAFIRGTFDVTSLIQPGSTNVLAIRVSPPPHPGIAHEQSVAAGPGGNGGNLAIDGPTFIATEGWDWIPGIRDRDTGIWQDVQLTASGAVRVLDPQVISTLRADQADININVPLENRGNTSANATVEADIEGMHVSKTAAIPPGVTEIDLTPLTLPHPRLWWPNGYGKPELYIAKISVSVQGTLSDTRQVRFGIREITYELSLFDHEGRLRRVEINPAVATLRRERLVDVRHEALKKTANGWAASLTPAGESSPAVRDIDTTSLTPYLAIRVNGVRIAARGGSWGMDDSRKRVSREHLEPYFRLHQAAHLNIIRNWLGQDTEEVFYDLADEYGLLILNDFWESTQNSQVEVQDPELFLANARDVIRRFRNHPSIAVWFGRNEGVPQPILNEGLADAIATLDGTRYYTGSSNTVNLQGSGPYDWQPPEKYFNSRALGFSVEVGTPSLASLESLQASIPAADLWPIGDVYAYHDWHFGGNGDTASFMRHLQTTLGAVSSLEDFERKAQLIDYVSYRAIFEGFQAGLWRRNSGRLLWMTHPSWPSNTWQIYTSDYDTAAPYYAVAKACEPLHAQLNLPDFRVAVVNTTRAPAKALRLRSRVVSLNNRLLFERVDKLDAPADDVTTLAALKLFERTSPVLVELTLTDSRGTVVSNNVYWEARKDEDLTALTRIPLQALDMSVTAGPSLKIKLHNPGPVPALMAKVGVLDASGNRVLPAYYSDNYVTLLPGETRDIDVTCPKKCASITLRGWNVQSVRTVINDPLHAPK